MGGWVRYFQLKAKAKTGFSAALLVWAAIALLALLGAVGFLIAAGYIWLAIRYGAQMASLIMAGGFILIAVIAGLACMMVKKSAATRARLALAERKHQPWLDPAMLGVGLQVGRSVGWGRLLSLGAVAILAAGLGREWLGGQDKPEEAEGGDGAAED
jgi:hypothetical protein